ncbi:alpha/beta hydrolase [Comamonas granuli]|uniref:alpha/beta hydrolase n=1 Tax=Comamonas granuli TaxID=290309 RepID=UPI000A064C7E
MRPPERRRPPRQARRVGAWTLCASLLLAGCAQPVSRPPGGAALAPPWALQALPGSEAGTRLWALERAARVPPLRYRVLVIPGSGCAGLAPLAERYFAGLLHAEVLVLHKRGVHPLDRTPPDQCPARFVQADALSTWRADARAALQAWAARPGRADAVPTVLVGISEGGELLPHLAPQVPRLAGLVLLSASGLDPRDAAHLQAQRQGAQAAWQALEQAQDGPQPDTAVVQGRSLRYWRALWHWRVAQPLIDGPWPLWQVWGDADALVPPTAYERFAAQAQSRTAPFCSHRLPQADHGLQSPQGDGVQWLWARLEQWARQPAQGWCAPRS